MLKDMYDKDCMRLVDDAHFTRYPAELRTALVDVDGVELLELAITDSRDNVMNTVLLDKISAGIILEAMVGYLSRG